MSAGVRTFHPLFLNVGHGDEGDFYDGMCDEAEAVLAAHVVFVEVGKVAVVTALSCRLINWMYRHGHIFLRFRNVLHSRCRV